MSQVLVFWGTSMLIKSSFSISSAIQGFEEKKEKINKVVQMLLWAPDLFPFTYMWWHFKKKYFLNYIFLSWLITNKY